jgi:hypothetical protein
MTDSDEAIARIIAEHHKCACGCGKPTKKRKSGVYNSFATPKCRLNYQRIHSRKAVW